MKMMLSQLHIHTPLLHSHELSHITGRNIYLKMEALQPTGSFKDRGVGKLCQYYAEQDFHGFVSSSGGNAGISVAYAGKKLGCDVKVFVPRNTLELTIKKMRNEGAEVTIKGDTWDQADAHAKQIAKELDYAYIPPFDHPVIWQGYESIIDELKIDLDKENIKPDAIITSVGGGGLFCGLVQGLQKHGWLDTTIITAETTGAASLATSYQKNKHITLNKIDTIATTLGAKQISKQAFNNLQDFTVMPQTLSDKQAVVACLEFADDNRVLVEPSCGAALAIAYSNLPLLDNFQNIVIVVCGGSGVSLKLLSDWKKRFEI
jgi:L-serine/L-threonine ammonia-lyase